MLLIREPIPSLTVQSGSIRVNVLRDFAYFIYANDHSKIFFCEFISNHFELENGVKMTPKRRSFLSALYFICFLITKPLLIEIFCTNSF